MPEVDPRPALQRRISLDVADIPLTQVAAQLGKGGSFEIVYDDKLDRSLLTKPVTLRLNRVTVDSLLYWVGETVGLTYYVDENRVVLTTVDRQTSARAQDLEKFRAALERRWRPAVEESLKSRKISCDVEDITLAEAAELLRTRYGVNSVASPELMETKVTVKVQERPIAEVLDVLAKSAGAGWVLEHEAVHFERVKS